MTDTTKANTISDLLRTMTVTIIDRPAFWLLGIMYEIFFNVASAELFSNQTIKNFYSRVQLIIGVFMVFKLAVTILQGIINPDTITDKKSGISNIITRIIFSLVMLTLIVPINIPGINENSPEYQIQLNNNGLLFGTLYSLQNRLLSNNTLGRLILGTTDDATNTSSTDDTLTGADKQAAKLKRSANIFTSTILKGFVRINLLPEDSEDRVDTGDKSPETDSRNWMCQGVSEDIIAEYRKLDVDPDTILSLVNLSCEDSKDYPLKFLIGGIVSGAKKLAGTEVYVFAYRGLWGGVVALIFAIILLGFTVDIAVRSVKLAVLRLLAPIPIISYIDPKSGKDGAFASWVKTLTSTYLDLFIRLAVVYFVIFLIQDMIVNGIVINTGTGVIGIISAIFIWIGLFFFARQAPKFIRDVLGLKGNMQNIGLSAILGGTAALTGGGGAKGFALGAMQGAEGSIHATNQGKNLQLGDVWRQNSDMMAKIKTGDKDARGGMIGKTMDRLNYGVRENRTRQLGIGRNDLAIANYEKDRAQAAAANANKQLADAETRWKKNPNDENARQAYLKAKKANNDAQIDLEKAKSKIQRMEKDRGLIGANPRVIDTRSDNSLKYRAARAIGFEGAGRGTYASPREIGENQTIVYRHEKSQSDGTVKVTYNIDYRGGQVAGQVPTIIDPKHPELRIWDKDGNVRPEDIENPIRYNVDLNSDGMRDDETIRTPDGHFRP